MTMIYARIANRTVAEEYFTVAEKVEALYGQLRQLPRDDEGSEMRKLRGGMHRRMLGNGHCARPVQTDCHFESICESCTFFVTTIEFRPTLQAQRDDAQKQGPSRPPEDLRRTPRTPRPRSLGISLLTGSEEPDSFRTVNLLGFMLPGVCGTSSARLHSVSCSRAPSGAFSDYIVVRYTG
jgi:hypothetical protein